MVDDSVFPDPTYRVERSFEDLSLRAGVNWTVGSRTTIFGAFGEAFLPPSVEQLFSFPLFGSNRAF